MVIANFIASYTSILFLSASIILYFLSSSSLIFIYFFSSLSRIYCSLSSSSLFMSVSSCFLLSNTLSFIFSVNNVFKASFSLPLNCLLNAWNSSRDFLPISSFLFTFWTSCYCYSFDFGFPNKVARMLLLVVGAEIAGFLLCNLRASFS